MHDLFVASLHCRPIFGNQVSVLPAATAALAESRVLLLYATVIGVPAFARGRCGCFRAFGSLYASSTIALSPSGVLRVRCCSVSRGQRARSYKSPPRRETMCWRC